MSIDYSGLIARNAQRWDAAQFHDNALAVADHVARRLVEARAKAVYQAAERDTHVPWFVIAVIHEREASQRWNANIGQGDPWNRKTIHVPRGRGPFSSWHEAALDALENCAPYAARWKDWSAGGALTLLELYNGLGYEKRGIASPYLWSGTQHYRSGKYVSDGKFNAAAVDTQLGCAVLLKKMMELDPSISFGDNAPVGLLSETGRDEIDPAEFPGADATADAPAPSSGRDIMPARSNAAPDAAPAAALNDDAEPDPPKSMLASKISNTQIVAGGGAVIAGGSQLSSAATEAMQSASAHPELIQKFGLLSIAQHAIEKPMFWFALIVAIGAGLTIYWRWKDHGRGNQNLTGG